MIQKLSRNRLERRNTQSTRRGVRYMINMLLYIIEAWRLSLQMSAKPASNTISRGKFWWRSRQREKRMGR